VYLAEYTPARKAPVAGKGPADAGRRGGEADVCTDSKQHDDASHDSCSRTRLYCLMEDGHEGECWVFSKHCIDVAEAEEDGQDHGEAQGAVDGNTRHDGAGDDNLRVLDLLG
jgi:hypothetical protein